MDEQHNDEDLPAALVKVAALLRVDPHLLADSSRNIRANSHKIWQVDTWKDISGEVPKRVKVSAVLVVLLIAGVWWGQSLLTPAQKEAIRVALPHRFVSQPQKAPTPTDTPVSLRSAAGANATPTPPPPLFVFHTVEDGESLIAIAAKYNITTEALLVANNVRDPSELHQGQTLLIPPPQGMFQQKIVVHDVLPGDTLLSIASKYGSSVKAIEEANPQLAGNKLAEGTAVAVPIVFEQDNLALDPGADADIEFHTVQPGEYPLAIAAQYDIPVEVLLSTNNITDATRLQVGDVLQIPPHEGLALGFPVILYELVEGDTLVGIASRFGSSVKDILAINPELNPAELEPGQMVAIPVIFVPKKLIEPTIKPLVTPTPVPPPPIIESLTRQMAEGINAERATEGLPPYQFDLALAEVALGHDQDMVVNDFVAHTNLQGQSPRDRVLEHGISDALRMGENIQVNSSPAETTVAAAIKWFMNSPPHRAGILNKYYNRFGVAAVQNPAGWYYFVIVFAQRGG